MKNKTNLSKTVKKFNKSKCVRTLGKHLKKDEELFYGYQSNIAMAFYDEYSRIAKEKNYLNKNDIYKISNAAAINFLNLFINH